MPLIQLLILVNAATMEMKNLNVVVVDKDLSVTSRQLVDRFSASPFFHLTGWSVSLDEAQATMEKGKADIILNIPTDFEKDIVKTNRAEIQLLINAINGIVAGIGYSYAAAIIGGVNRDIITKWYHIPKNTVTQQSISTKPSFWYNPELNYKVFMVPAVLAILVTVIGLFLSGLNIVREKELGTIEQINVTPIRKYQFIFGKLTPFLIIGLLELAFGLLIGKLLFNIPINGSLFVLFTTAAIYLVTILGIGLLISTLARTLQQSIFISFFFIMVFMMMSGLFTSVETMPNWAQDINVINPIAYFMKLIRTILLKGSGFQDIYHELIALVFYGLTILGLATWRYRKTE